MKKIASELKRQINKLSYRRGIAHGELVRAVLMAEVERRLAGGEDAEAVADYLRAEAARQMSSDDPIPYS
jgi:hypothetical protein